MKKMRMILCFVISFIMILTMTGMTASATEDVDRAGEGVIAEEGMTDGTETIGMEQPVLEEGPMQEYAEEATDMDVQSVPSMSTASESYPKFAGLSVSPVTKVKVVPGYDRIKVKWTAVPLDKTPKNVNYKGKNGTIKETNVAYKIYRNGEYRKTVSSPSWEHYMNVKMYKVYKYKIVTVKTAVFTPADGSKATTITKSSKATVKKGQCVRKMRIKIKPRRTRSLTSHDGKKKHATIKAGKELWSDGYKAGCYYFKYKGGTYRLMRENAKALKADYAKEGDYTREAANYFMNRYVKKNKVAQKKYLIWVSSYHQRLYLFKKVGKNKWKCVDDWNISMGMKSSPSPTGKKEIHKRIRSRHNIPYWNVYSGAYNALHSRVGDETLGRLASHGCIRNPREKAKWIWDHCPKGTTVLVY